MKRPTTIALLLALGVAAPASAEDVIDGRGKAGRARIWQGTCQYSVFGPRGVLRVGVYAPRVRGANTRRRTRRERTYVRYRITVIDASSNSGLVNSTWSDYIRVRQSRSGTWTGPAVFDMVWQGNYGADIRIEWRKSRRGRRVGWRTYRTSTFAFYDQYDTGPYGPISSCYKYTAY